MLDALILSDRAIEHDALTRISGRAAKRILSDTHRFGADQDTVTTYERRGSKGGQHRVTRHTSRGLPPRRRKGRVVFPAAAEMGRRLASLFVQTIVRGIYEASEGKSS